MLLRKYQLNSVEGLRNSLRTGHKRPFLVSPTGSGKSIAISAIIKNLLNNSKKVLWIVHRRNLLQEMYRKLKEKFDIEAGIIMAGHEPNLDRQVQLCSIQTYGRRINLEVLELNKFFIDADVILIDEAHRAVSKTYKDVIKLYEDKIIIGCSATPCKADGRGMGEVFDDLVIGPTVKELTDGGYLSPVRYFVPGQIDLSGVKELGGDYQIGSLEKKINKKKLIGDIVENWLKLGENRKTLVYAVNVKHSIALCEAFQEAGIKTARLDAHNTDEEREEVFEAMQRGDVQVLVNVLLYVEGLDVPSISCIVFARPTKSLGLYRQAGGRGLRIEEGKDNLIFLDHANVVEEFGTLDEEIEWTLDGKKKAFRKTNREGKEHHLLKCRVCGEVFSGTSICPTCGSPLMTFGKAIETVDAELEELLEKEQRKTNKNMSWADKRRFVGALAWHARKKGYKAGWVAHAYKDYTGVWPNDKRVRDIMPIEPEGHIKNLLTHILIKKAKAYDKEQKNGHQTRNQK